MYNLYWVTVWRNHATAILSLVVVGVLLVGFSILAAANAAAAERGRVRIQNGTVVSDRNTILRGATNTLLASYTKDWSFWRYLNVTLGLNAVRFGVKTITIDRTVEQQLPGLDNAVNAAAANNLYLMINNSIDPGGYNIAELKKFWSVVAPRYRNRTHVFYEMTNEPTKGAPQWGDARQYTDSVRADIKTVYDIMRSAAPDTHIVLFSGASLFPDCNTYAAMVDKLPGIDWTHTSIGFHHYAGTQKFGEAGLTCLRQKYPLIMTETNYWVGTQPAVLRDALSLYEKIGMSWFSLDGKGRNAQRLENEILPALHAAGYNWPMEN